MHHCFFFSSSFHLSLRRSVLPFDAQCRALSFFPSFLAPSTSKAANNRLDLTGGVCTSVTRQMPNVSLEGRMSLSVGFFFYALFSGAFFLIITPPNPTPHTHSPVFHSPSVSAALRAASPRGCHHHAWPCCCSNESGNFKGTHDRHLPNGSPQPPLLLQLHRSSLHTTFFF